MILLHLTISYGLASLIGYWMHRILHSPKSGWFHRIHHKHHHVDYPPERYTTKEYIEGSSFKAFSPAFVFFAALMFTIHTPWTALICTLFGFSYGAVMALAHDSFHVQKTVWSSLLGRIRFNKLKANHFIHHVDEHSNFGILDFFWDKVFKSFRRESHHPQQVP